MSPGADSSRPFYDEPWPPHSVAAARAMWDWHLGLYHAAPSADVRESASLFASEARRALDGVALQLLPGSVSEAAYEASEKHALPRQLLADQVRAAERFTRIVRFPDQGDLDTFIQEWAVSLARLLARLADADHSWHQRYVQNLAKGLFLTGRLIRLSEDVRSDRIFVPLSDLEQAGVAAEELETGRVNEPLRRLLWKQIIRARDALAQGAPLATEIAPRFSRALRKTWMGAIELLNEIERRDYDVWSAPLTLSPRHRLQVRFQARFGRTTFRGR